MHVRSDRFVEALMLLLRFLHFKNSTEFKQPSLRCLELSLRVFDVVGSRRSEDFVVQEGFSGDLVNDADRIDHVIRLVMPRLRRRPPPTQQHALEELEMHIEVKLRVRFLVLLRNLLNYFIASHSVFLRELIGIAKRSGNVAHRARIAALRAHEFADVGGVPVVSRFVDGGGVVVKVRAPVPITLRDHFHEQLLRRRLLVLEDHVEVQIVVLLTRVQRVPLLSLGVEFDLLRSVIVVTDHELFPLDGILAL